MKSVYKVLLVLVWAAFGILNYGLLLGGFTHEFPDQDHMSISVGMGIVGPLATPAAILTIGPPYHFLLKPYTTEQRWEAFHKSAPELDREYFEQHYN